MTEYAGCKSLDAEIKLDFVKGTVNMDYSLNRFGRARDSNSSAVIDDEMWKQLSGLDRLKIAIPHFLFFVITIIPFGLFTEVFFVEQRLGVVGKTAQYEYQKILKWYYSKLSGIWEQLKTGELLEPMVSFTIPHNIWIEYTLSGEYQEKIKSIALVRNFVNHMRFGKYPCRKQQGWNVVFEFTELPKSGYCKVGYV